MDMKSYTKAQIVVLGENDKENDIINVHFNPSEYNISNSANYADKNVPGIDGPIVQYISGATSTLDLELVFDTYEELYKNKTLNTTSAVNNVKPTDVSKITRRIVRLTEIFGKLHRPPICLFKWGSLKFKGVITKVDSKFTMFTEDGMPVRAKLNVTFQSVIDVKTLKKSSPFESPDRSKSYRIKEGIQLWHVAAEEYGDPSLWRVIAEENGITNPKDIYPGQLLRIPPL